MVLTPDQKKRIAELDQKPPQDEDTAAPESQGLPGKLKDLWFNIRNYWMRTNMVKALLLCLAIVVAGYFVVNYQLYRIDFGKVFSSGPGTPVDRLWLAVKSQKHKADMVAMARAQFLVGDYEEALITAAAVAQMDPKDQRAQSLIGVVTDAATMRAAREFDSGEMEAALADVKLALKHRPEHENAKELSSRIEACLLREAQAHYAKREYAQLITKAQEVRRLNPSDVTALNLLVQTNKELLTRADEFFISKRYAEALENVQQSLRIDPKNSRALRLLKKISLYVDTPDLELLGIIRLGKTTYARIHLPRTGRIVNVKKGDRVTSSKVTNIDPVAKTVTLMQIYTRHKFTIELPKSE